MIRWGGGRSRGCCIVLPIGCLVSAVSILALSGLALTRATREDAETLKGPRQGKSSGAG